MRKDELKSGDCCPDCEDANAESDSNVAEECCCCCCSCSETSSEAESSNADENQHTRSLEDQKKDLLSSLSVLRTNREPASVQNVLQFVEALTHSSDFLRRYNLQEDFCLQCLLSEPTCTCCVTGISQINLNDQSCDSCEECNGNEESHHQRYPSQECPDCASSTKAPNSARQRTTNRRERRRRRRQRNIRHNLPRVSSQGLPPNRGSTSSNFRHQRFSDRDSLDGEDRRNPSQSCETQAETIRHTDNCEECAWEEISRRGSRLELKTSPEALRGNSSEDSEFCEECARENLPSTSYEYSYCRDCDVKTQRAGINSRCDSSDRRADELCDCCCRQPKENPKGKSKKNKVSGKPECDQNETCTFASDHEKNQSAECSCNECQSNSECSDESCDECCTRGSKKKK